MRKAITRTRALAAALLVLSGALLGGSGAAVAATGSLQRVGRAPALPLGSTLLSALSDATPMRITVALNPRDAAALTRFATAVSTAGSPDFHRYLEPGQFAERFGASDAQITAVERSLRADGLTPGAVAADRLSIPVTSTAGALSRAFGVSFTRIREASGVTAVVNSLAPALPAAIAPAIQAVIGLSTLGEPRPLDQRPTRTDLLGSASRLSTDDRAHAVTGGPQPCAAATAAAPGQSAYTADQIASAYNFSGLYQAGDEGQGTTIGVYELESDDPNDIATYQACYGTHAAVSYVQVDGGGGTGPGSGEAALDIEQLIGLAPKATLIVYQGPNANTDSPGSGPYDVFAAMINADQTQVISNSYGECEAMEGSADAHGEETLFEQAAAQGQTIVSATGDNGSEDCDTPGSGLPDTALAADDPGSQPFVTGAGGTSLTELGPPPVETAWNNGGNLAGLLGLEPGAGGGGVSALWPMPAYQSGAAAALGVINGASSGAPCGAAGGYCRETPDVSAVADPDHGVLIYFNGSGAASGEPSGWQGIGGTSAAAPLWAALAALADSSKGCSTGPIGFANPALYRAAGSDYAAAFHDIISGNNDFTDSHHGLYPATPGYDMATGLGSPDAAGLAPLLCADSLALTRPGTLRSTVHAAVRYQLRARNGAGAGLDYVATGLPRGLRLNPSTGLITGAPTRAGSNTVAVTVTDANTDVGRATFTWVIAPPPKLSGLSLRSVAAGRPALRLKLSAGSGPAFTKLTISLPAGLRLAAHPRSLTLSGTGGTRVRYRASVRGQTLTLTLPVASSQASLTLRFPALKATAALIRTVHAGRRPSLRIAVRATSASGANALTARLRPTS
jgi:subtilase family serine protease